jgi:hypothetical protein
VGPVVDRPNRSISCNLTRGGNLGEHYRLIGQTLVRCEREAGLLGSSLLARVAEIRASLAAVPIEVLESYLEDLLSPNVSDETLYVRRDSRAFRLWMSLLMAAAALGVIITFRLDLPFHSFLLASTLFTGVLVLVASAFFLRSSLRRRVLFARVLSRVIADRRGRGARPQVSPTGALVRWLRGPQRRVAPGMTSAACAFCAVRAENDLTI